ncbi:transposase [Gluconobacter thailandicus]|uniref:IS66 family insertion sequence element accessory protein TnpA n=1 Tax=Gluconobacter thailandicus TaxID=257438 RepID=UPI0007780851|nr:transposase [Gluconobacter thailandicus]KXV35361.1 transposase [Gluconobacter thailandicus]
MRLKHYENKARQTYWVVHMEAWRLSGLARTTYCLHHRLNRRTFDRWMNYLIDKETARKHAKTLEELQRQQRREARAKRPKKRRKLRYAVCTDIQNRALQAYWAMHVEAMNWSGMGVREYAAAMYLSPSSLRTWRDRLADGAVEIDWRAHLHPSARPSAGTSAKEMSSGNALTASSKDDLAKPTRSNRRLFTDEQKLAIVMETEQRGATVSGVARKHGIVSGLLFRWRAQFGFTQKKQADLASVALSGDTSAASVLRDLIQPPPGMTELELPDRRRVLAPADSDPDLVRTHAGNEDVTS